MIISMVRRRIWVHRYSCGDIVAAAAAAIAPWFLLQGACQLGRKRLLESAL